MAGVALRVSGSWGGRGVGDLSLSGANPSRNCRQVKVFADEGSLRFNLRWGRGTRIKAELNYIILFGLLCGWLDAAAEWAKLQNPKPSRLRASVFSSAVCREVSSCRGGVSLLFIVFCIITLPRMALLQPAPSCSTMAQNLKSQNSRALGAGRQTDTHRDRNLNRIPEIRVVVRLRWDRNNMQSQRCALLQEIRVHEVRTAGHIERTCFHKRHVVSSWSWRPQSDPRCLLFLKCRTPEGGD